MKKFIIAMLIMLTGVAAASARDSYSRDIKVLPAAAQNFIARNFKAKVNLIKIDSGTFSSTDYDVILTDGSEIDFDSVGNWKDIEVGRSAKVPDAAVKQNITTSSTVIIRARLWAFLLSLCFIFFPHFPLK